jgi:hypothetical protein
MAGDVLTYLAGARQPSAANKHLLELTFEQILALLNLVMLSTHLLSLYQSLLFFSQKQHDAIDYVTTIPDRLEKLNKTLLSWINELKNLHSGGVKCHQPRGHVALKNGAKNNETGVHDNGIEQTNNLAAI